MTSQLGQEAPVARATARFIRVTPMKARRVVDLVRYLPTDEALVVSAAYVDEGPTMKRIRPRAQGRAFRINKRTSHITVEVSEVSSSVELAQKSRKARRDTGRSGPAVQQQDNQGRTQSRANTRGGTR